MAWRIYEQVVRGEIDNRIRGRMTGKLWLSGREQPLILDLKGNAWRDLAGRRLLITNPAPQPGKMDGLADLQAGVVGDITASRKVKVPDVPMEEFLEGYKTGKTFTFHWSNCLYLEWFSDRNGRVVIESVDYRLEVEGPPSWEMTEAEEQAQLKANHEAIIRFMDRLTEAFGRDDLTAQEESDKPTSRAEAEAETARMDRLLDRVQARLDREGLSGKHDLDRIMEEEREKLRREKGESEPEPLSAEEEAERSAWIEEMNAASEEALEDMKKTGGWKEPPPHPLQEMCSALGLRLHHEVRDHGWIPESATGEHPLYEVLHGVQLAGTKLAGALSVCRHEGEWPPDPLFAGDTLVRLKKTRAYLRDALAGLDAADEQRLAEPDWRGQTRREIMLILGQVDRLIHEVRSSLEQE